MTKNTKTLTANEIELLFNLVPRLRAACEEYRELLEEWERRHPEDWALKPDTPWSKEGTERARARAVANRPWEKNQEQQRTGDGDAQEAGKGPAEDGEHNPGACSAPVLVPTSGVSVADPGRPTLTEWSRITEKWDLIKGEWKA